MMFWGTGRRSQTVLEEKLQHENSSAFGSNQGLSSEQRGQKGVSSRGVSKLSMLPR